MMKLTTHQAGTAGTGKSYLIHCLRLLLDNRVHVAAPTGVAAFNIGGHTLHSLLSLPVKGDFKKLQMQQSLAGMEYVIIDKMSMVRRKFLGQVDQRLWRLLLETLANYGSACPSTPVPHFLVCQMQAVLPTSYLTVLFF